MSQRPSRRSRPAEPSDRSHSDRSDSDLPDSDRSDSDRSDSDRSDSDLPAAAGEGSADDRAALAELVGDWTTVPDIAARLRMPLSRVRQYLADRELIALRLGERRVVSVPAKFLGPHGPRPELKGTFTVLADGGMGDEAIVRWLFTPDQTLPVPGAPIDALLAGHKTEIRRRAQALAL